MAKSKIIQFLRIARKIFVFAGIIFLLLAATALTTLPFWGYYWLGNSKTELTKKPTTIVLLAGGGMPSESNLMRCWYTQQAAQSFSDADVMIAAPGELSSNSATPLLIQKELTLRGIHSQRIHFENEGTNTRSQALNCATRLDTENPVLLVTSPEHMRRAVLSFQKAGFAQVNALPAFENTLEADLSFDDDRLGGNTLLLPDVGHSLQVRYQFWNHMKYEILIAREMLALTYYRMRGWI